MGDGDARPDQGGAAGHDRALLQVPVLRPRVRDGPIISSGVAFGEAEENGEHWFAHRADGTTRIGWENYDDHWQMAVWEAEYRERWCDNVADELEGSPWDGVLADNDVYDDYYGLRPPIEGGRRMSDIRARPRPVRGRGRRPG